MRSNPNPTTRRTAEDTRARRGWAALCALLALALAVAGQRVWAGASPALLEGMLLYVTGAVLLLIARDLATP